MKRREEILSFEDWAKGMESVEVDLDKSVNQVWWREILQARFLSRL
jgi:hypothetical protein